MTVPDGMMECRCGVNGGEHCYQQALAAAADDQEVRIVEFENQSRRASGVPFHVTDPVIIQRVADVIRSSAQDRPGPSA